MKLVWIVACLLLASTGCSRLTGSSDKDTATTKGGAESEAESERDPMAPAMAKYAKGYNKVTGVMKSTIEAYQRGVDGQFPPSRKPILVAVGVDRDLDDGAKSFEEAKKLTPDTHGELPALADNVLKTARDVHKDFGEAKAYYDAENYKDDKGAKGKTIHDKMTKDVKAYREAVDKLDAKLEAIEEKLSTAELAKHSDPATYGHQFRAYNSTAKRFLKATDDPKKVQAALEAEEAAYKKVKAFADGKGSELQATFKGYMKQVENFHSQATVVARNARDKAPENETNRNLNQLTSRYNNLIQLGNSLYDLEAQGIIK